MSLIIGGTSGVTFPDGTTQTTAATTPTAVANLSGGAAGKIPFQTGSSTTSFTAAGTTGQVLTSAGTGTPTWSTPSSGAMTLISTLTASSSASLSWTGLSGYDKYFLVFENLITGGVAVKIVLGTGGTPTYLTSGYAVNFNSWYGNPSGFTSASNFAYYNTTAANFEVGNKSGRAGYTAGVNGWVNLNGFTSSVGQGLFSQSSGGNNTDGAELEILSGYLTNTSIVTAIQLYPGGGTFTSGTASLYGITS